MNLTMKDLRQMQAALFNYANASEANATHVYEKHGSCESVSHWREVATTCNNMAVNIEKWLLDRHTEKETLFRLEVGPVETVIKQLSDGLEWLMDKSAGEVAANLTIEDLTNTRQPTYTQLLAAYNLGRYDALAEAAEDLKELPF